MPTYSMMQIDAFTDQPLGGNPCAVVFDADDLSPATMQAIAQEMNLSETAFVMRSDSADFRVRYFTPAEEIPLAGHPTIATTFALVQSGRLKPTSKHTTINLELQVGPIQVDVYGDENNIERIVMTQKKPQFLQKYDPGEIAPLFHLEPEDLLPDVPIQTVSTGTPQLMVAVKNHDVLRKAYVNIPAYVAFRSRADFFSPHFFCLEGATSRGRTFARHFGTPPDTFEDPFTGSATGGMAAYIWHHGLLDDPNFIAEQGHWMNRPGKAWVEVVGARDDIETVRVGGQAVGILKGHLML